LSNISATTTQETQQDSTQETPQEQPADAGGAGGGSNEPAGLTRIAAHDGSTIPGSSQDAGTLAGKWRDYTFWTSLEQGTDAAAASPPGTIRMKFPAGQQGGTAPSRFDGWGPSIDESGSTDYSELYISYWTKWEGADIELSDTKVHYLAYANPGRNNHSFSVYGGVGASLKSLDLRYQVSQMKDDGSDPGGLALRLPVDEANNNVTVGQWHRLEFYYKINDIGPTRDNGVFKMWLDGKLVTAESDIRWRSDPTKFFFFTVTPVIGGSGTRSTDDFMQFDDLYISAK
jgi:hypothetical protein